VEYAKIGAPRFDGQNYTFWNKRMKTFLQEHGFDFWKLVVDGYKTLATPPTDRDGKKLRENNSKDKGTILSSLVDSIFFKVMHCDSAKDIWDTLQNIYEGYAKVKGAKLQIFRAKFEQLKLKEDEDIVAYLLQVDEVVNTIKGLDSEVDLREELINSLEELMNERNKKKLLKEELKMKEVSQNCNSEELEQMILSLKIQIEEDKRIE
jgi:hypothetical protein